MKPPRHFRLILGRIAHAALGPGTRTLCGRPRGDHPVYKKGLTAGEALRKTECRSCRRSIRP